MRETVLVTGAAGFAGRSLVPALIEQGYRVRAHGRSARDDTPHMEWRALDLMDSLEFGPLLEGCDAVIHLAASLSQRETMDRVNVEATRALVAAAQTAGVRYFGHASSITVYGSPKTRRVNETTPRLDPRSPLKRQYHAEPYMRDYARTKALAEEAIEAAAPAMPVDIYRPTIVADAKRLLEARHWSAARRALLRYRRTQYVWHGDVSAAIIHLMRRGLDRTDKMIEAWNFADDSAGTFVEHFRRAYRLSGDRRWRAGPHLPVLADLAKDALRYRPRELRYPLGMLKVSTEKLRATGFELPTGVPAALEAALRTDSGDGSA